jgi:3-phenylpropionate/cinnamic acid dioxygenase small subunit
MNLTSDDKVAIQELSNRYANAMDNGDADGWLDTWDDAGVWEGGLGRYEGKANLRKLLDDLGARIQGKRHVMTNFVINGFGLEARQTCYLLVFEREMEAKLLATGVYTDRLKKVGGMWKFVHRSVKLDPSFRP